jgi:hypothetical protein
MICTDGTLFRPRSLVGSSAAVLVDSAPELDWEHADYADKRKQRQALVARRKARDRRTQCCIAPEPQERRLVLDTAGKFLMQINQIRQG